MEAAGTNLAVDYVEHSGSDLTVVNAARISYGKVSGQLEDKDVKLIKYLAKNKHMSPFEHNSITIIVTCPLYVRSQIHRHRTFSYNELSRRYTSEGITFYTPVHYRMQSLTNKQASGADITDPVILKEIREIFERIHITAKCDYDRLLELGLVREQSRGILPQNLMTKFYMTGNLRNYMHFLSLRDDDHAQDEVQIIARGIRTILKDKFPISTEALEWSGETNKLKTCVAIVEKEECQS